MSSCTSSWTKVPDNLLLRRQTRTLRISKGDNGADQSSWGPWKWDKTPVLTRDSVLVSPAKLYSYPLELGGRLLIALDLLSEESHTNITTQVRSRPDWFRSYPIQGVKEPRAHFILHKEATQDFAQPQPGYKYRTATVKARPLSEMPLVDGLADQLETIVRVANPDDTTINNDHHDSHETFWNLGINVVLYRSGRDRIGQHADKAQGETAIFTLLAHCPYRRRICIESNDQSVRFELFLQGGDGYCMDGEMQNHYTHGVPAVTNKQYVDIPRIALVFRRGVRRMHERDTGEELSTLQPPRPKPPPRQFGQIDGLYEGHIYSLTHIVKNLQAHNGVQVGVSGNEFEGCDSIVVAGKHRPETDSFFQFEYTAETKHGGYALDLSANEKKPIRVLRSSKSTNPIYRPPKINKSAGTYRYDGLYYAQFLSVKPGVKKTKNNDQVSTVIHTYLMVRANPGTSWNENRIQHSKYIQYCLDRNTMLESDELLLQQQQQLYAAVQCNTNMHNTVMAIANDDELMTEQAEAFIYGMVRADHQGNLSDEHRTKHSEFIHNGLDQNTMLESAELWPQQQQQYAAVRCNNNMFNNITAITNDDELMTEQEEAFSNGMVRADHHGNLSDEHRSEHSEFIQYSLDQNTMLESAELASQQQHQYQYAAVQCNNNMYNNITAITNDDELMTEQAEAFINGMVRADHPGNLSDEHRSEHSDFIQYGLDQNTMLESAELASQQQQHQYQYAAVQCNNNMYNNITAITNDDELMTEQAEAFINGMVRADHPGNLSDEHRSEHSEFIQYGLDQNTMLESAELASQQQQHQYAAVQCNNNMYNNITAITNDDELMTEQAEAFINGMVRADHPGNLSDEHRSEHSEFIQYGLDQNTMLESAELASQQHQHQYAAVQCNNNMYNNITAITNDDELMTEQAEAFINGMVRADHPGNLSDEHRSEHLEFIQYGLDQNTMLESAELASQQQYQYQYAAVQCNNNMYNNITAITNDDELMTEQAEAFINGMVRADHHGNLSDEHRTEHSDFIQYGLDQNTMLESAELASQQQQHQYQYAAVQCNNNMYNNTTAITNDDELMTEQEEAFIYGMVRANHQGNLSDEHRSEHSEFIQYGLDQNTMLESDKLVSQQQQHQYAAVLHNNNTYNNITAITNDDELMTEKEAFGSPLPLQSHGATRRNKQVSHLAIPSNDNVAFRTRSCRRVQSLTLDQALTPPRAVRTNMKPRTGMKRLAPQKRASRRKDQKAVVVPIKAKSVPLKRINRNYNKKPNRRQRTISRGEFGSEIVNMTCLIHYKFEDGTMEWVEAKVIEYMFQRNTHWHRLHFQDVEGDKRWLFLEKKGTQLMISNV